jgi:hypothetical protein
MRASSGFWFRILAVAFFAASLIVTKGAKTAVEALLIGAVVVVVIGYPIFRRRGRVP